MFSALVSSFNHTIPGDPAVAMLRGLELVRLPRVRLGRPAAAHRGGGRRPAEPAPETGPTHFFKEHAWGYGTDRRGSSLRYAVEHPLWRVYPEAAALVDLDFGTVYGADWSFLTGRAPEHVTLAEGSAVAVFRGERLRAGQST